MREKERERERKRERMREKENMKIPWIVLPDVVNDPSDPGDVFLTGALVARQVFLLNQKT